MQFVSEPTDALPVPATDVRGIGVSEGVADVRLMRPMQPPVM